MATIREKIAGLYIAFFNRAGDKAGVEYWENEANSLGEDVAIKKLAFGFSTHPKFSDLYGDLSNREFVESIYKNTLGSEGDTGGIEYWTAQLDGGVSRSDMVADFISLALDFNPNDPQYSGLSQEDIDIALKRQALISNKVDTSLEYITLLEDKTNLDPNTDPSNPSSLESDPAYRASIKILSEITDDRGTVESVTDGLKLIQDRGDAIDILNGVSIIDGDTISNYIDGDGGGSNNSTIGAEFSHINSGLGSLSTLSTEGVAELNSGSHWSRDEITFSFNETIPASYYEYDRIEEEWGRLNDAQKGATRSIISEVDNLLSVKFREVEDNGDIRFNILDMPQEDMAGFSFYPADNPDYAGDVFLSSEFNNPESEYDYGLNRGEGGWATITHELGHALGLKHPFEGSNSLTSYQDDMNHTIMSYIPKNDTIFNFTVLDSEHIKADYKVIAPDLYSLYDVSALQAIYGANRTYQTGDNRYSTKYTDYRIQTIYDAGGEDTIDLSNTTGKTTLDLRGGSLNSVDEQSVEDIIAIYQNGITDSNMRDWIRDTVLKAYQNGLLYTGKDNFGIAQGVIIENLITGSGNDIVTDNLVDNRISTGSGDDIIHLGNGGYDHIDGGDGNDSIYLSLLESQVEIVQLDNQTYSIMADNFYAEIKNIETIQFGDNSHMDIV